MTPPFVHTIVALDCFGGILYLLFSPRIPRAFLPWLTAGIVVLHLMVAGILYWLGRDGALLTLPGTLYLAAPIVWRYQDK